MRATRPPPAPSGYPSLLDLPRHAAEFLAGFAGEVHVEPRCPLSVAVVVMERARQRTTENGQGTTSCAAVHPFVEEQLAIALRQVVDVTGRYEPERAVHLDRYGVGLFHRREHAWARRAAEDLVEQRAGDAVAADAFGDHHQADECAPEPVGAIGQDADGVALHIGYQQLA